MTVKVKKELNECSKSCWSNLTSWAKLKLIMDMYELGNASEE